MVPGLAFSLTKALSGAGVSPRTSDPPAAKAAGADHKAFLLLGLAMVTLLESLSPTTGNKCYLAGVGEDRI